MPDRGLADFVAVTLIASTKIVTTGSTRRRLLIVVITGRDPVIHAFGGVN
jgi:hypothetical protein